MPRHSGPARRTLGLGLPLLLLTTLLGGCASSWQLFETPADRVSDALDGHRYADALAVIDNTGKGNPQYGLMHQQRPGVLQASREYRHDVLARARALAAKGQWRQAYATLEQARDQVVDAKPVQSLLDDLHHRENSHLRDLLINWYLAEARALLRTGDLDPALKEHTGTAAHRALARRQRMRHDLTDELTRLGNEYADQARWQSAYEALEMAQRLSPRRQRPAALERARKTLDSAHDRAEIARNQAHREHAEKLIKQYQDSGRLQDLLAARTFLLQHPNDDLDDDRDQVDAWCQQRFQTEVSRGDALYARGRYRAAYQLWKQALPLDPNNVELGKKLERAGKVLHSLKTLSEPEH